MKTPVAFLIFNRPDVTARVFERIGEARPTRLLIVADGARTGIERAKVDAARSVVERIDWPCEVERNYSEINLGCRKRVASGLNWVFDRCDEAIILEDDCLPEPTFFRYCDELLERYRDDERVAAVSGNNFQFGRDVGPASYYFSIMNHIWGWASWRRAWKHFDSALEAWQRVRDTDWLEQFTAFAPVAAHYRKAIQNVIDGKLDTWDVQWTLACWLQNGLTALPRVNLVSNIGFGAGATHTKLAEHPTAGMATSAMEFPLRHPSCVERDLAADVHSLEILLRTRNL